jgi:glycosyltransferase involved in cell wall biosynthesis
MAADRPSRLLLHREASPLSRGAIERRLLSTAEFSVYDFDDALYSDWGQGGLWRRLAPKAAKAGIAVAHADRVIAGNGTLADWASERHADVVVIPSCVAVESYRPKERYELADPPRLGWIGSPHNDAYLGLVAPALREVHRRTGARLTLIGTTRPTLDDLERFIDRVPWTEAAQHDQLADVDVGIAPLPDTPYTRGKCGYRLLQYGAAGTPAVGSPIGVNRGMLAEFGMPAAEAPGDWADALLDLLGRSSDARERLGRGARETVRRRYSYDAWLRRWQQAVGLDSTSPPPVRRPRA